MYIETRQAYSEVNKFLELIGEEMRNKIPYWCKEERKKELLAIYSNNEKKTSRRNV